MSTDPAIANATPFEVVLPTGGSLETVRSMGALPPFSPEAIAFLGDVSSRLLRTPELRHYPELVALGYWMRPRAVEALAARFTDAPGLVRSPRGVAFHIAPSNVDTIFVYSWMVSLIAGNGNVIRLSRESKPQMDLLLATVGAALDDPRHAAIRDRTLLIRYAPDPSVTAFVSNACDVRVIWGGDATVAEVRQVALPPLATEVVFGDRFSIALVSAAAWLASDAKTRDVAMHAFANDAYWFMQMACSSPRMVVWVGTDDEVRLAREDFWGALRRELPGHATDFSAADYLNKRTSVSATAAALDGVRVEEEPDADIVRLWLDAPDIEERWRHCGAGLFWETSYPSLDAVARLISRPVQTVTHFGFERDELVALVRRLPRGGDRWVPFGRALDFDYTWDGLDLVAVFTRLITVRA